MVIVSPEIVEKMRDSDLPNERKAKSENTQGHTTEVILLNFGHVANVGHLYSPEC